jgi:hypothetical protein
VLEVEATRPDTPFVITIDADHAKAVSKVTPTSDITDKVAAVVLGLRVSTMDRPARAISARGP